MLEGINTGMSCWRKTNEEVEIKARFHGRRTKGKEFKHEVSLTGVIYANKGHDTLHISTVDYAELKGYPVKPFYVWLLAQLQAITKGQDND